MVDSIIKRNNLSLLFTLFLTCFLASSGNSTDGKLPGGQIETSVTFSYPNELTKISTRGSIQNIYKYDAARGWLNAVQTNNGTINYAYDAAGNRTQVRISGRDGGVRVTNYAYDALNRVSTVSRVGVGTLASYTAVGNVDHVFRANGVKSTFGYDDLHRLTAIEHTRGTKVLSQFNYALSADGKRNTVQEYINYPAEQPVSSVNRTVFYGYDGAGRLNAEQRQSTSTLTAGGSIAKTARTLWTYDKVGNRLTQAVSNYDGIGINSPSVLNSTFNTSYSYNINDWLTSTTSTRNDGTGESTFVTNFEYNANGSQSVVISNVGTADQKRVPYFYDFEQKLVRIGNTADPINHTYAYDADGNRIAESNTNASNTTISHYLVDPNNSNAQIVEEYNNESTLQAHYDWNDAELLCEANWNTITNAYDIHEPLADGHNNVRQLVNTTGTISDVYAFDAWGNQQVNIGNATNPYRYNSQRLDKSGLYYLRARQYSSGIGRFISHDPMMGNMRNPITQHRYLYAGDDAVNAIDPSGEVTLMGVMQTTSFLMHLGLDVVIGAQLLEMQSSSVTPQIPANIYDPNLEFNHQYIDVAAGPGKLDGIFELLRGFRGFGNWPRATSSVDGIGDVVRWDWNDIAGFIDNDFYVRSNQFNAAEHFFSVETMKGHPLRGHRFFQVSQIGSHRLRIETGAVEKPNGGTDFFKLLFGGRHFMSQGWKNMLYKIVKQANVTIVSDHSNAVSEKPAPRDMAEKVVSYP